MRAQARPALGEIGRDWSRLVNNPKSLEGGWSGSAQVLATSHKGRNLVERKNGKATLRHGMSGLEIILNYCQKGVSENGTGDPNR